MTVLLVAGDGISKTKGEVTETPTAPATPLLEANLTDADQGGHRTPKPDLTQSCAVLHVERCGRVKQLKLLLNLCGPPPVLPLTLVVCGD